MHQDDFDDITVDDPFAEEQRLEEERLLRQRQDEMDFELDQMLERIQSRMMQQHGVHPAFRNLFGG